MYDFISIFSDETHSQRIEATLLEAFLISELKLSKESHLKFFKEIGGEKITIMGIPANSNGATVLIHLKGLKTLT
ncbi:hypothetical protein [Paenibacillus sp. N3.4]|uniref:hypothetical protein n=1 Tax=Paenibacillus sp. N3.4 TaxID=2603222 RepID=UPI0011CC95B7|nr:hypothetical protein [Paenibacillus sp. N3.4]TXK68118.1 hypothetical protein FU659_34490 [Paenibacillus sp. N3.4]